MKNKLKIGAISLISIVVIIFIAWLLFLRSLGGNQNESSREISVTKEYAESMRNAGYPITVKRAFRMDSYGGWHGDGSSLTAFQFHPDESSALIESLKEKYTDYTWKELPTGAITTGTIMGELPEGFAPSSANLLEGAPSEGLPLLQFVIDKEKGLLYTISNQF